MAEKLPSESAVSDLANKIFELGPKKLTFWDVATSVDPHTVYDRIVESSLGDLMLKEGDTLSALETSDFQPELGLFVSPDTLVGAGVRGWRWTFEDEQTANQLDILLYFENTRSQATHSVSSYTSSYTTGSIPTIGRDVYSPTYAEMGYEGHNQATRVFTSEEEALGFVALAEEMFQQRVESRRAIR